MKKFPEMRLIQDRWISHIYLL